ncbi:MAG TPA: metalloregulator ArsR/SmtB family transcription factor [Chitinispirillaceae bacterium]|jgi:ArsR family transcriptional regulator|nr:metalloregulator ArsR/SmtB family transcription factor [Chitinispirillaceae bacterium]
MRKVCKKSNLCDSKIIHQDIVSKVKKELPPSEDILDAADFFSVLGDSTRMGILYVLSKSEMCGCDISALLSMTQSAVSHQLRVLKQARLVSYRREGKIVYFRLADKHVESIMKLGMEHVTE